ncbi:MAG: DUF4169 family protein [Hyphomonadaceae bacterium]|nr:DUF4169 family protein [Hyphomonadaceae bacterium]
MAEPVNVNKFRKAKARAEKQQRAAENRIKHGRTKAEKARDKLENNRSARQIDESELDS